MLNFNDPVAQKDGSIKPLSEGSGGGGGGIKYSTEETKIGKFLNKDMYSRVFEFSAPITISNTTWQKVDIDIDMDEPIESIGLLLENEDKACYPLMCNREGNSINFSACRQSGGSRVTHLLLTYTKKGN